MMGGRQKQRLKPISLWRLKPEEAIRAVLSYRGPARKRDPEWGKKQPKPKRRK